MADKLTPEEIEGLRQQGMEPDPSAGVTLPEREEPKESKEPSQPPPATREPTPPPAMGEPPQVVSTTSGEDTYIVREQIPGAPKGEYKQSTMTKAEIEAKGGTLPEKTERENILHQIEVSQGYQARQAKEAEFRLKDTAEALGKEFDVPLGAMAETIQRFKSNPESEEFKLREAGGSLTVEQKTKLAEAAGVKYNPLEDYQKSTVEVGVNEKGEPLRIGVAELERLKSESPELYETLTKEGYQAYQRTLDYLKERASKVQELVNKFTLYKQDKIPDNIVKSFADEHAISEAETVRLTSLMKTNPDNPEFEGMRDEDREALRDIAGDYYDTDKLIGDVNNNEVSLSDVELYFGKGTVDAINAINEQAKRVQREVENTVDSIVLANNVKISDRNNLSVNEMVALIGGGLDPKALVVQGQNVDKVNEAVDAINVKVDNYRQAQNKLANAGFVAVEYPKGGAPFEVYESPEAKPLTIQALAQFQRQSPDDTTTIKDYFTPELAERVNEYNQKLGEIVRHYDQGVVPIGGGLGLKGAELTAIGRAFDQLNIKPVDGSYVSAWRQADEDTKYQAADLIAKDPFKSSTIASLGADIDLIASKGLGYQLLTAPIAPITHVIAKQISLPEAREILSEEYSDELTAVSDYKRDDGTVDAKRLKFQMDYNPNLRNQILEQTGYEKTDDLVQNLEYYNNGMKVTTEEWAIAGAVGALDVLMLGGAGALASLGLGGRVALGGIQVGSAGVFLPSSIRAIKSPDVPIPEKVLAGAMPILLIAGGALSIKAPSGATLSPVGKIKVPIKEIITEGKPVGEVAKVVNVERLNTAIANEIAKIDTVSKFTRTAADVKIAATRTLELMKDMPALTRDAVKVAINELDYAMMRFGNAVRASPRIVSQAVKDAVVALEQATAKVANAIKELPPVVKEQLGKAVDNASQLARQTKMLVSDSAKIVANEIDYALSELGEVLKRTPDLASKTVQDAVREVQLAVDRAGKAISELPSTLKEGTRSVINTTFEKLSMEANDVKLFGEMLGKVAFNDFTYAVDRLIETLRTAKNYTGKAVGSALKNAEDAIITAKIKAKQIGGDLGDRVLESIKTVEKTIKEIRDNAGMASRLVSGSFRVAYNDAIFAVEQAVEIAKTSPKALAKAVENARAKLGNAMRDVGFQVSARAKIAINDMNYALDQLVETVKKTPDMANKAVQDAIYQLDVAKVKAKIEIDSLLASARGGATIGKQAIRDSVGSLQRGINDIKLYASGNVKAAMNDVAYAIERLVDAAKRTPELASKAIQDAIAEVDTMVFRAKRLLGELPSSMSEQWQSALDKLAQATNSVKESIKSGIGVSSDAVRVGIEEIRYQANRMAEAIKSSPEMAKRAMAEINDAILTAKVKAKKLPSDIEFMARDYWDKLKNDIAYAEQTKPMWEGLGDLQSKVGRLAKLLERADIDQSTIDTALVDIDGTLAKLRQLKGYNTELDGLLGDLRGDIASRIRPIAPMFAPVPETPQKVESPVVWAGLKVGDNLVVGISDGKLIFGKSGIKLPPKEQWDIPLTTAEGKPYEPRTGLETSALINRKALETAGMTPEEAGVFADRMQKTVGMVKEWYGKPEQNLNEVLLTEPIDTFSKEAVETIFRYVIENSDKVKNIRIFDRLYGSATIRPQLSAEALAEWINEFKRMPGDFDIQLKNVGAEGAESFAKGLVGRITKETNDPAWINPDNNTLVMAKSRSTGADRHGIDIHYPNEPTTEMPLSPEAEGMVYGLQKTLPALNVKLEGIGDFKIARLSETSVGKMEQVLGWRANPETKAFELAIEPHRFPKDIIDLYEIVKTKKGVQVADEWLDFMGYDKQKLIDLQNNIVEKVTLSNDKLSNAANVINELKESVRAGADDAVIKSKLVEIKSDLTIAKDVVEGMPQSEARIAYTKANNALKELDSVVSRDIQDIPSKLTEVNRGIYRSVGRELGEFSPVENARVSNIGVVAPLYTLASPALISASRSYPIGVTSEGNIISAPIKTSPSEYPSVRLASEDIVKSEPVYPSEGSPPSVSVYPSPSASIFDISPSAFTIPSDAFSLAEEPPVSEPISPSEPSYPSGLIPPSEIVSPSEPISPSEPVSPSEYPSIYPSPKPSPYPSPYPSIMSEIVATTTTGRIPIPIKATDKDGKEVDLVIQPGSVVWVQGRPTSKGGGNAAMYKVILPPYTDESKYTTREVPPGYVDEGWSGKGSVKESIQVIGGLPPSNIENIDLGFVRVNITQEGGKPKIEFVHDKDANVGERSRTVGMGRGQIPVEEWDKAKAQGIGYEDFIRSYKGELVGGDLPSKQEESQEKQETEQQEVGTEQELQPVMAYNENEIESRPLRKPKNLKNWWDSEMYEPVRYEPTVRGRYYRGRRLLPPNLGGEI